jgi:hypothetical protein
VTAWVIADENASRSTGQRGAGRDAALVGDGHHQRVQAPHLLLEETDGVVQLVAAKRIRADQLGQLFRLVDGRGPHRPHLVQDDR